MEPTLSCRCRKTIPPSLASAYFRVPPNHIGFGHGREVIDDKWNVIVS